MTAQPIAELESAVLLVDLPDAGLKAGDVGTVVYVHPQGGYIVEFISTDGEAVGLPSLSAEQVAPLKGHRILHARPLTAA